MKLARLIAIAGLVSAAACAHALDVKPYSAAALAEAQKSDKPIALHFHADWCPTCRAQDKVLESLKSESGLDLTLLTVNYDTEKDLKRRFNVRAQSTIVVMHGPRETARLGGDTSKADIRAALKSAL